MDEDLELRRKQAIAIAEARLRLQQETVPVEKPEQPTPAPKPGKSLTESAADLAELTTGALAPYATAAGVGAAAGLPFAGVGAIPGAVAGVGSLALGDISTAGYNLFAPLFGGQQTKLPSQLIREGYQMAGIGRAPETAGERMYTSALEGAVGGLTGAAGAKAVSNYLAATSPQVQTTTKNVIAELAKQPGVQAAAGAGGAFVPSAMREAGIEDPGLQFAGGLVGGMGAGMLANRMLTPRPGVRDVPSTQDLRDLSQRAYRESAEEGVVFSNPTKNRVSEAQKSVSEAGKSIKALQDYPDSPGLLDNAIRNAESAIKNMGRVIPEDIQNLQGAEKAKALYGLAEDAVKAPTYKSLIDSIKSNLSRADYNPTMDTPVRSVLREMESVRSRNVTFEQLNNWNTRINQAIKGQDPYVVRWGMTVKEAIDDFILDPKSAVTGDSVAAAQAQEKARTLWTRMRKSETVEDLIDKATRNIERGQDPIQALKTQFNGLINRKKDFRLFTPEEQKALRAVVKGSFTQNTLDILGAISFGKNPAQNILALLVAGTGNIPGVLAVGGSYLSKQMADTLAMQQAERAAAIMRGMPLKPSARPTALPQAGLGALTGTGTELMNEPTRNAMRR